MPVVVNAHCAPAPGQLYRSNNGADMSKPNILPTMIHHSHNADGTPRGDHCCGCFNVDLTDLLATCNECGESRDIASWLSGEDVSEPLTIAKPQPLPADSGNPTEN